MHRSINSQTIRLRFETATVKLAFGRSRGAPPEPVAGRRATLERWVRERRVKLPIDV